MAPASTWRVASVVTVTLILGVANPIFIKAMLSAKSVGAHGETEQFSDPWLPTLAMFMGMALALPADRLLKWRRSGTAAREVGDVAESQPPAKRRGSIAPLLLPAALDMLSSTIVNVALIFLPVSIWQMLRGSSIIFSAIASILVLGKRLEKHHWLGVVLCTAGVTLAGLAKVLDLPSGVGMARKEAVLGIFLVLVSQVFDSMMTICEERVLRKVGLPAMQVAGVEGAWGLALTLLVYAASFFMRGHCGCDRLANAGLEQVIAQPMNTAYMLGNSTTLPLVTLAFLVTVGAYNIFRISVIEMLSGVQSVMVTSLRMIGVWLFDLAFHYAIAPRATDGEAWTSHSYMELLALVLLVLGQVAYAGWLAWPTARGKDADHSSAPACACNDDVSNASSEADACAASSTGGPPTVEQAADAKEEPKDDP